MNYNACEAYLSRHLSLVLLILIVATATVYSGSLRNGFVWDDHDVVEQYPLNSNIDKLPELFVHSDSISGWPKAPFYRPLARATYVIDRQLFGLSAWCYHLENLLLHLANVLLLFCVARSLFREVLPALITAALFAVHPGICEPVFAIFARNTLLSFFFMLAAILVFQRGVAENRFRWFIMSAALFFLGTLSKEAAIMVLPLIACYLYAQKQPFKTLLLSLLPFLAALAVYGLLRNNALVSENIPPLSTAGLTSRLVNDLYIIPRYFLLLAWPTKLTVWHEIPKKLHDLIPQLIFCWFVLVVGTVAIMRFGGKAMKCGLFWGVCLLVPVLGVWAVPGAPMAERHLYGPFAGFAMVGAALGVVLMRKRPVAGSVIIGVLFALLSARTIDRSSDWLNDITLFQSATRVDPDSVNAHYNLGEAYEIRLDMTAALNEWLMVTQLSPGDIDALSKVGTYYFRAGRYEEALPYFARAVAVRPEIFGLLNNLGSTLDMLGRSDEAVQQYELALQAVPPDDLSQIARLRERIEFLRGKQN